MQKRSCLIKKAMSSIESSEGLFLIVWLYSLTSPVSGQCSAETLYIAANVSSWDFSMVLLPVVA